MPRKRPVILVPFEHYLPGYRAGGPVRSIAGIVRQLADEFEFRIITQNRDLGQKNPYPDVAAGAWQHVGGAQVLYLSPGHEYLRGLVRELRNLKHDLLYLNSAFSAHSAILPFWATQYWGNGKVLCAPRGQFSQAALSRHAKRKRVYLRLCAMTGMPSRMLWQASSAGEQQDIRRVLGNSASICLAPAIPTHAGMTSTVHKAAGSLRLVYLARVHPHKNLYHALRALRRVQGKVEFSIYGPLEDPAYWAECKREIRALPENISVEYRGEADHVQVSEIVLQQHVLVLPTRSENYGHSIVEALVHGRPVLISDQTPWTDLENFGAGRAVSLDDVEGFTSAIQDFVGMGQYEYDASARGAREYARIRLSGDDAVAAHRQMFQKALAWHAARR